MTKMKTMFITLTTLFFSFTHVTDNPIDRLGVKGPLEFNKIKYNLAWTDKPNANYYIQEYLPDGEKPEKFNQMLTIHLFDTDIEIKEAVGLKLKELEERKKTDGVCKYMVTESPDGKEFIVDFLLGESKDGQMTIVEFNVYHYKRVKINKKKEAIVVYAFTKRSYGEDIRNFFSTLKEDRTKYLNEMISAVIPNVTMENK